MMRILTGLVGLFCLGYVTATTAQPRLIDKPEWLSTPTGEQIAHVFPDKAMNASKSGWAVIECRLTAKGSLEVCQILGEGPDGYEFGEAALRLAPRFKFNPKTKDGEPLEGGYVRVPVLMLANGATAPQFNYMAGGTSILIAPAAAGAQPSFPCATSARPNNRCQAHRFNWDKRPKLEDTASLVRSAGIDAGKSSLTCQVGADYRLANCSTNETHAARRASTLALAPLFVAPELTVDKTPTAGGLIVIDFDWQALRRAVDTSVMSAEAR